MNIFKLFSKKSRSEEAETLTPPPSNPYYDKLQIVFDTLKYWTPELIEWIGKEKDPVKLAVTSSLLNCGFWPDWLPSKPADFEDFPARQTREHLYFVVNLMEMVTAKAEVISPGLDKKIWLTDYYQKYLPDNFFENKQDAV